MTYGTKHQLEFRHIVVNCTNQHKVLSVYFRPLEH